MTLNPIPSPTFGVIKSYTFDNEYGTTLTHEAIPCPEDHIMPFRYQVTMTNYEKFDFLVCGVYRSFIESTDHFNMLTSRIKTEMRYNERMKKNKGLTAS